MNEMQAQFIRKPAVLTGTVALGYCAGRITFAAGMSSAVFLIFFSLTCPILVFIVARPWRIPLGLLVNGVMVLTVTTESYLYECRIGGLGGWWRDFPMFATFAAILVLASLIVTIPASLPEKAA